MRRPDDAAELDQPGREGFADDHDADEDDDGVSHRASSSTIA